MIDTEDPAVIEHINRCVHEGRPGEVLLQFLQNPGLFEFPYDGLQELQQATDQAALRGPEHLAEIGLTQALKTCLDLMLRVELLLGPKIQAWDRCIERNNAAIPKEVNERFLPVLTAIQKHMLELVRGLASLRRATQGGEPPPAAGKTRAGQRLRTRKGEANA